VVGGHHSWLPEEPTRQGPGGGQGAHPLVLTNLLPTRWRDQHDASPRHQVVAEVCADPFECEPDVLTDPEKTLARPKPGTLNPKP